MFSDRFGRPAFERFKKAVHVDVIDRPAAAVKGGDTDVCECQATY